ncbi:MULTISPECIES: SDR family NAD(P)-dependent oxidoreductase [Streptomyces]|uniref:SDR family NAD(P)-dependent oxidoreductase n=2 Tax=Streptomyces TaxID=1883 RepID=A0ABV9J9I4_9ACTN
MVTRAASGMGLFISRRLTGQGHRVAMFDVQGDAVRKVAKHVSASGGSVLASEVDVTDREAVEKALSTVREEFARSRS